MKGHWTISVIVSILILGTLGFSQHVWAYSEGNDVILKQDSNLYIVQYQNGNGDIINLSDSTIENIIIRIKEYHGTFELESQAFVVKPILRAGEASPFFSLGNTSDCDEIWVESYKPSNIDKVQNVLKISDIEIIGDDPKWIQGQLKNTGTKSIYEDIWVFKIEYEENEIKQIESDWLEYIPKGKTKSFSLSYSDNDEYEIFAMGRLFDTSSPSVGSKFDKWYPIKTLYLSNYFPDSLTPTYLDINELTISDKEEKCQSSEVKIPEWVRNNAKWWSESRIGDSDFVGGIQYLIKVKIMKIPETVQSISSGGSQEIPGWIKNNADWWSQGLISDDDFVKGIQYLVEQGIIKI